MAGDDFDDLDFDDPGPLDVEVGDYGEVELTEDGVARSFTERYGRLARYDEDRGRWFWWGQTAGHWQLQRRGVAFHHCRELIRAASEGEKPQVRAAVRRSGFMAGVERCLIADEEHAVMQDVWDRDPMLLGCPGVTIDLRTGEARRPDPEDLISRQAGAAPDDAGDCPTWRRFLDDSMAGNEELVAFLQVLAGYCLTGDTREETFAYAHGSGGNGKSTWLGAMLGILGDYGQTAAITTFVEQRHQGHTTELAALRGARLVVAEEVGGASVWDEARIKSLTGGGRIRARFMHRDDFEFAPAFKLLLAGNSVPDLRAVDEAMRRRIILLPFDRRPRVVDDQLKRKLVAEYPGILRWAIAGCLEWQERGLRRPDAVVQATESYFEEQDVFGAWIGEVCETGSVHVLDGLHDTSAELYASWVAFAGAAGKKPGSSTRFGKELASRGFRRDLTRIGGRPVKIWRGIRRRGLDL